MYRSISFLGLTAYFSQVNGGVGNPTVLKCLGRAARGSLSWVVSTPIYSKRSNTSHRQGTILKRNCVQIQFTALTATTIHIQQYTYKTKNREISRDRYHQ